MDYEALGVLIAELVAESQTPLLSEIAALRAEVATLKAQPAPQSVSAAEVEAMLRRMVDEIPRPKDAEPLDPEAVASDAAAILLRSDGLKAICDLVATEAVTALPPAQKGEPGQSVTFEEVAAKLLPLLEDRFEATASRHVLDIERRAQGVLERAVAAMPKPKDGENGRDGKDGRSVESFERAYDPETHEIVERWIAAEQPQELRYTAGGIRGRGYWREGVEAKAAEAWTHDGTMWIAVRATKEKPSISSPDWYIGARRGRDGERGVPGKDFQPDKPVPLP